MPISTNLLTAEVRDANAAQAMSFFSNWRGGFWPKLCRTTVSTRDPEPFTFLGAVPMMGRWFGSVPVTPINSYVMQSPNFILKNLEYVDRYSLEMDQIGALPTRMSNYGLRLAQYPDWLTAGKLINGNSQTTVVGDNKISYPATIEQGIPFFSTSHTTYGGYVQSNIIQGQLPETLTELNGLDMANRADRMQKDLQAVLTQIASVVDDKGAQCFPEFQADKQLVVVVPMSLAIPARLAFSTLGATIGGSNGAGGSSGATTSITPMFVKDVVVSGLLQGCTDIAAPGMPLITPTYPTQYYFLIVDSFSSALWYQQFKPKDLRDVFPLGNISTYQTQIDVAIADAKAAGIPVTREAANVFAAAEIGTNMGAPGASGQPSVYETEQFFFSGRARGTVLYGLWIYGYLVSPSQTS